MSYVLFVCLIYSRTRPLVLMASPPHPIPPEAFRTAASAVATLGQARDAMKHGIAPSTALSNHYRAALLQRRSTAIGLRHDTVTDFRRASIEAEQTDRVWYWYRFAKTVYSFLALVLVAVIVRRVRRAAIQSGLPRGQVNSRSVVAAVVAGFIMLRWLPFSSFPLLTAVWRWLVRVKDLLFPHNVYL